MSTCQPPNSPACALLTEAADEEGSSGLTTTEMAGLGPSTLCEHAMAISAKAPTKRPMGGMVSGANAERRTMALGPGRLKRGFRCELCDNLGMRPSVGPAWGR